MEGREHRARNTAKGRAHAKGQELHVAGVDAHGLGGDFIFADGHPGATDAAGFQTVANDHAEDHKHQKEVVVQRDGGDAVVTDHKGFGEAHAKSRHRINAVQTTRPVGDVVGLLQVVHEDTNDFAKPERDDGQIVTPQLEHGCAQEHPGQRRQRSSQRDDGPQRCVQTTGEHLGNPFKVFQQMGRRQQRVHVGAHSVKRDKTEVQQTGVTDHDVQAQRQQHIQHGQRHDAHPALAKVASKKWQNNEGDGTQGEDEDFVFHDRS